ncbi:hypothetical protein NDU88_000721 [Pleurodeles waltl]|uniref:Uncharacterized protein n=1 Tax=Pleurodeles waltl TaxID=8319 RepID=A0AAV7LAJ4_PLEWA|nr:hypothetical protein NDU88_000721 [Pleurodeles waltl]
MERPTSGSFEVPSSESGRQEKEGDFKSYSQSYSICMFQTSTGAANCALVSFCHFFMLLLLVVGDVVTTDTVADFVATLRRLSFISAIFLFCNVVRAGFSI